MESTNTWLRPKPILGLWPVWSGCDSLTLTHACGRYLGSDYKEQLKLQNAILCLSRMYKFPQLVPIVQTNDSYLKCLNLYLFKFPRIQDDASNCDHASVSNHSPAFFSFFWITEKGQRFIGHSCPVTDPKGLFFSCGQIEQSADLMIFTHTTRTYHHSTHPILYGLSGPLNNNELAYVETGISDGVIQSGIRCKDGLQRWHSMKSNALLYTQTPRLHLVQLPSSSINNDRGIAGVNWCPIHPAYTIQLPKRTRHKGQEQIIPHSRVDRLQQGYRTQTAQS